jgi:hypothetical protein
MRAVFDYLERRPLALALLLSTVPYVGLRLYVSAVMHSSAELAEAPGAWLLTTLVAVGVVVPAGFLCVVVRRLVSEREQFALRALLEVYFSVILVFASAYAVLQAGGTEAAFQGMPEVWERGAAVSASAHLERLHGIFGDALYLSVVTMTTVGYGDIVAVGFASKTLTALQGLLGIGFVGLVLGQYFSACMACLPQEE